MIRKVVLPVAGLGTRMLPATKVVPKEMLPVVDKPVIQYALEEAWASGIEEAILVTGRGKAAIEDHFDRAYELEDALERKGKTKELDELASWLPRAGTIGYTRQQEPLGLGHAVWCARHLVGDEPFAVMLVDDLMLGAVPPIKQLIDAHGRTGGSVISVEEVPREHTQRYGILVPGADDGRLVEVRGMVEKPRPEEAPSTLSVIGRYVLVPEVFRHLDRQERGAGGEIQLTDAIARTIGEAPVHGLRFEGRRYDCGSKLGYLEAQIACALEREELRAGVQGLLKRYR